jgi:hypothetical protein
MDAHPHLGKDKRSRSKSLQGREPFVWRKAEDGLLGRRPFPEMADMEHHHTNCNHNEPPAQMQRSKSMANLGGADGHGFRPRSSSGSGSGGGKGQPARKSRKRTQTHLMSKIRILRLHFKHPKTMFLFLICNSTSKK